MESSNISALQPRQIGSVNWLGLKVLIGKEIGRFVKVYAQTIVAPVITTALFYLVFALALGGMNRVINGVPYMAFLAPGLIMMSMAQNAFANTSSSLVISKVQGNIVDVLMPPLSAIELTAGFVFGGIARGLMVGFSSVIVLALISDIGISHIGFLAYHAVMGSMMLATLGLLGGIWSEKFDHLATVQNFVVMPATFLSGTFYDVSSLSPFWQFLCHLNPFFYMIDGFRYGFIGVADGSLWIGVGAIAVINILLLLFAYRLIDIGYKLKS